MCCVELEYFLWIFVLAAQQELTVRGELH